MKKYKISIVAALLLVFASAHASFNLTDWQFKRPIVTGQAGFVKLELPAEMQVRSDFADLRVVNQSNIEVPYFLARNAMTSGGISGVQILNKSQNAGKTSFIADAGRSGLIHTGIILTTSSSGYQRQVSVYASDSLLPLESGQWKLITSSGYVFKVTDPTTGSALGKNEVIFPANTSRYFKVVIGAGSEGAVEVSSASLYGNVSYTSPTYSRSLPVTVTNNPERKTTEVVLDQVSAYRTDSITLNIKNLNYSRKVVVETKEGGQWRYVGEGYISSVKTSLFMGISTTVNFPELMASVIRLSIVNDDNPPLNVEGMATVSGPVISVIFESEPSQTYSLYYGNERATTPNYDLVRLSSYVEQNKIPSASLAGQQMNAQYVAPKPPTVPFTEAHKWLLNGLLVVVVLALLGAAGWYLTHLKKHETHEGVASSEAPANVVSEQADNNSTQTPPRQWK